MNKRDQKILKYLWRWKLLSTAALREGTMESLTPASAYTTLWRLMDIGLISPLKVDGDERDLSHAWSLTKTGFKRVLEILPGLQEVGFRSESPSHDVLVSAVHIGEWLKNKPQGCEVFSEQELRRLPFDLYPSWVPKSDVHRPDGYWRINKGGRQGTVALEVERTQKSKKKYSPTITFYEIAEDIYRVIWVVRSKGIANTVSKLAQANPSQSINHFNFFLENDFRIHGWQMRCFLGRDVGKSLEEILVGNALTSRCPVNTKSLLCLQKCPHKSGFYESFSKPQVSDRVVPSLLASQTSKFPKSNKPNGENTNE